MKLQLPQTRTNQILLGIVVVAAAVVVVIAVFYNPRAVAGRIVDRIYETDSEEAKRELKDLNDRAAALDALKEALLSRDGNVAGKRNILNTLLVWKESRTVHRAFRQDVPSTQRAAATLLSSHRDYKDEAVRISLEWLQDEGAPSRHLAIRPLATHRVAEALPVIEKILARNPETEAEAQLFGAALNSLPSLAPDKTAEVALKVVREATLDPLLQMQAMILLRRAKDAPVEEIRDLLVARLLDPEEDVSIRLRAAIDLEDERFAGEKSWAALQQILLDESIPDSHMAVPRHCLRSLGRHLPRERLKKLLHDRRVYNHRHPFIRQDVAVGFASLGMNDRLTFDILCELLVHEDPKDETVLRDGQFLVRQEAWLSLWSVFGYMFGVEPGTFRQQPPPSAREHPLDPFWSWGPGRPGVTKKMVSALQKHIPDLAYMQRVQETYQQKWPELEARRDRAKEEEEKEQEKKDAATDKGEQKDESGAGAEKKPPQKKDEGQPGESAGGQPQGGADPEKESPGSEGEGSDEERDDETTRALSENRRAAAIIVDRIYDRGWLRAGEDLRRLNDRAAALEALQRALQRRDGNVEGKRHILFTLLQWEESGAARRALESDVPSTRRTAASILYRDPAVKDQAIRVCLEWLQDEQAPGRGDAVGALSHHGVKEALPYVEKILAKKPRTKEETELHGAALEGLVKLTPQTAAPRAFALARDSTLDVTLRLQALIALRRAENIPVFDVRELLTRLLLDSDQDVGLRLRAAIDLEDERFAAQETWRALKKVLLDESIPDRHIVVPRHCLRSLGRHLPHERLERLLHGPRVYRHRYPFVRQDVAVAMAALGMDDEKSFDVLCEMLVYEDPKDATVLRDTQFLVRQEAWLSLWSLHGKMFGVDRPALFGPPPLPGTERPRDPFRKWGPSRPGVNSARLKAVQKHISDLDHMREVRRTYEEKWSEIRPKETGEGRKAAG
jgi:hypothetical protein